MDQIETGYGLGVAWVSEVHVNPRIAQKIVDDHGLSVEAVVAAVVRREVSEASWDDHPRHGRRLLVKVTIKGRRVLIALFPAKNPAQVNHYHLGTAHVINRG